MKSTKAVETISYASKAEIAYIENGKAVFEERFPKQIFDDNRWSIKHLKRGGAGSGAIALTFQRIEKKHRTDILPKRFADIVKSHIVLSCNAAGSMVNRLLAIRWMWEATLIRLGGNAEAFSWQGFRKDDPERAEAMLRESGLEMSSVYRICVEMRNFLSTLISVRILPPIYPTFQVPRKESFDRYTLDGREQRMKLLATDDSIYALGRIFKGEFKITPFQELLTCLAAIMFASGCRVEEGLELQLEPLLEEGERKYLLIYAVKNGKVILEKRSLSTKQAELVAEAVRRATLLTADVRERASELVNSPDTVPLPSWAMEREELDTTEVACLMGYKSDAPRHLPATVRRRLSPDGALLLRRDDLQGYLQERREKIFFESIRGVVRTPDGSWLPLHKALFIHFLNSAHDNWAANKQLVGLIKQAQFGQFLGGKLPALQSIFEKLGLAEKTGEPIQLNSHQFRHYVTSKAASAGVPDVYIAQWQRRSNIGDLQAYKHLTNEEQLSRLKEMIVEGRLQGEVSTMFFSLAEDMRDIFLEGIVQAVHVTPFGYCTHDFNSAPCPKALNCVKGCGSFLFDASDANQRDQLLKVKERNEMALNDARKAAASGSYRLAPAWVNELELTNAGIESIVREGNKKEGVISPFAGNKSKFEALK